MAVSFGPNMFGGRDGAGGRVRSVLAMLGGPVGAAEQMAGLAGAVQDGMSEEPPPPEFVDEERLAAENPPRAIPNVTTPPRTPRSTTPDHWPADLRRDAEDFQQGEAFRASTPVPRSLPPGINDDGSERLTFPGQPAPSRPRVPTAAQAAEARQQAAAATPAARQQAAAQQQAARQRELAEQQRQAAFGRDQDRRKEAAEVGLNADPKEVEAARQRALETASAPPPKSALQDLGEREERASIAAETRQYERDTAQWNTTRRVLETEAERAREAGRPIEEQREIAQRLDDHLKLQPKPTARMRGGLTEQEVMEPVHKTVERLPEAVRKPLKAMYLRNHLPVGRPATPKELAEAERRASEDMIAAYDGLEPDERIQVMANDAARNGQPAALTYGAEDASTRGGKGFGIGDNAENYDMKKGVRRMVGTDVTFGDPVMNEKGNRGGTFVQDRDGRYSSRAPNMDQLEGAGLMATDPDTGAFLVPTKPGRGQMTPQWREQMKIAGTTLGLNPAGFDNEDAFIAAAAQHLERHRNMLKKYDAIPLPTGGYRYTPNEGLQADTKRRELIKRVDDFVQRYPDVDATEMYKAADAGDADKLLEEQTKYRRAHKQDRAQVAKAYTQQQTQTRHMRNPNVAPAMFSQDMVAADGDPDQIALNYHAWGRPDLANAAMMHGTQRQVAESQKAQQEQELELQRRAVEAKEAELRPDAEYQKGSRRIVDSAFAGTAGDVVASPDNAAKARAMHEKRYGQQDVTDQQGAYMNARDAVQRGAPLGHGLVSFALTQVLDGIWKGLVVDGSPTARSVDQDGMGVDSQRTTFIKQARKLVVGDKFTDEELGRFFDTNYQK